MIMGKDLSWEEAIRVVLQNNDGSLRCVEIAEQVSTRGLKRSVGANPAASVAATSMGRLTLNMLLSFAQFEREVTGERIRDKIAASKRRGMWMGGLVPLGYDVRERRLVANEPEAVLVRHIMRRYVALGSVVALVDELGREGSHHPEPRRSPVEAFSQSVRPRLQRPMLGSAAQST